MTGAGLTRRARVLVIACVAAACGESSTPVEPAPILQSGAYRLVLTMSLTGEPVCTGSGCAAASRCDMPEGAVAVIVPIQVRAERTGDELAVRPVEPSATFRMNLRVSGIAVAGTASGQLPTGGGGVMAAAGARPQSAAVVTGIATAGPVVATGTIDGVIMIEGAGCSNNRHRWDLDRLLPPTNR